MSRCSTLAADHLRMSGYDSATGIYHSKHPPIDLPSIPYLDIVTHIFQYSGQRSSRIALVHAPTGLSLTYEKLQSLILEAAAGLTIQMGIGHGNVVMMVAPNSIEYVVILFAAMLAGAVVTTANPLYTPTELANQVKDCSPKLIVTTHQLLANLASFQLPLLLLDDDDHQKPHLFTTSSKGMPTFTFSHLFLASNDPSKLAAVRIRQSDTAALLYSSGTTGLSKGVVIPHSSLIAATLQYGEPPAAHEIDIVLSFIPLYHIYGFTGLTCTLLRQGQTIIMMPRFDFEEMLEAIQEYHVTKVLAVPHIVNYLVNSWVRVVSKYDLSSLKVLGSGGAPLSRDAIARFSERYPHIKLIQGYGLTETCSTGTILDKEDAQHMGSAGLLTTSMKAKVIDVQSGRCLPPNKRGEIWLQGPSIVKGYLNKQEATESSFDADGWFRTGDLGYFNEDGFLYVVDRIKELIKYKAFQVAPAELEAILLMHPEIKDAAVIGFPDNDVGEIPLAFIVRSEGSTLREDVIKAYVAEQVAPHKKVRRIIFIDEIPKSSTGKIQRRKLAQMSTSKL